MTRLWDKKFLDALLVMLSRRISLVHGYSDLLVGAHPLLTRLRCRRVSGTTCIAVRFWQRLKSSLGLPNGSGAATSWPVDRQPVYFSSRKGSRSSITRVHIPPADVSL
ncbi:hypothetical protein LY76DRAFT_19939 [Colletotrichum caudatum]|nr:hypothetical protein LY76DRAFT_19939 [Colletotrichum caudatum]